MLQREPQIAMRVFVLRERRFLASTARSLSESGLRLGWRSVLYKPPKGAVQTFDGWDRNPCSPLTADLVCAWRSLGARCECKTTYPRLERWLRPRRSTSMHHPCGSIVSGYAPWLDGHAPVSQNPLPCPKHMGTQIIRQSAGRKCGAESGEPASGVVE
jgi:hypothetical protein